MLEERQSKEGLSGPERRRSRSAGPDSALEQEGTVEHPDVEGADSVGLTAEESAGKIRNLIGPRKGSRRLVKKGSSPRKFTAEQRLMLLDTWSRSGLCATDFCDLVGISSFTLYKWKKRFEQEGPAGLMNRPRGRGKGSKLPEITRRAILMLKQAHPEYGCRRISDELARGPALGASSSAVARVLHESGYELEDVPTHRHPDRPRRFERARPNQLWQTDLFSFVLKRQNRRVHLVAFMDDNSRFIVGHGLHSTCSSAMVIEAFRGAIASYKAPREVLTDNGSQYVTWRGKSGFAKECEKQGIKQIVSSPRHPQTLGKIERFWGTLWRGLIETAVFLDLEDARRRIALFIDHYNFQRPHRGIDGLVPADRYFEAAPEVLSNIKSRIEQNALELAVNGEPKKSVYLTGRVDGRPVSLHSEGEKVVMLEQDRRQDVDLVIDSGQDHDDAPCTSALDAGLAKVAESMSRQGGKDDE